MFYIRQYTRYLPILVDGILEFFISSTMRILVMCLDEQECVNLNNLIKLLKLKWPNQQ